MAVSAWPKTPPPRPRLMSAFTLAKNAGRLELNPKAGRFLQFVISAGRKRRAEVKMRASWRTKMKPEEMDTIKEAFERFGTPTDELEELIGDPNLSDSEQELLKKLLEFLND